MANITVFIKQPFFLHFIHIKYILFIYWTWFHRGSTMVHWVRGENLWIWWSPKGRKWSSGRWVLMFAEIRVMTLLEMSFLYAKEGKDEKMDIQFENDWFGWHQDTFREAVAISATSIFNADHGNHWKRNRGEKVWNTTKLTTRIIFLSFVLWGNREISAVYSHLPNKRLYLSTIIRKRILTSNLGSIDRTPHSFPP